MGKHGKTENLNDKPYNSQAKPEVKAKEFDQQYGQNRKPASSTPALDSYNGGRK